MEKYMITINYQLILLVSLLVRYVMEYGLIVWSPEIAQDKLRIECVQNRFLGMVARYKNIKHEPYDYPPVLSTLRISKLESPSDITDAKFLNNFVFGSIYDPMLLYRAGFRIPVVDTSNQDRYHLPMVRTNYLKADTLKKAMYQANHEDNCL